MNIKHLPLHLGLGCAMAIFGVVSGTLPAQAQSGNQSDVTGTIVTTSDAVRGVFNSSGGGRLVIVFATNDIRDSVFSAASSVNQLLAARNLPIAATGSPTAIPESVQEDLECVCTSSTNVESCSRQVENGLVNAGANPTLARNLVSSLRGLTARGRVDPARFRAVVQAYNALINNSSTQFLSTPPEELRAIQSVLSILLNAAYARR